MKSVMWFIIGVVLVGCAGKSENYARPLAAPSGTPPTATAQVDQGNKLYEAGDWEGAKAAYLESIAGQPTLAEAHYNLALTLERLGDKAQAKKHYFEAANLAPGNKVIWDAPPLRRRAAETEFKKHSFQDASPR